MKKSISILLCFLIFISSAGFSVSIHYCPMSKKTSYSLKETKTCCGKKADTEMEKKCCKNTKVKVEKIKDNYTSSQFSKISSQHLSVFVLSYTQSFLFVTMVQKCDLPSTNHEPPDKSVPLAILYRTFLI